MVTELLVPRPRIVVPKPKSYVKLDMAFGIGAGTTLYDKSRYRSHGAISGAQWIAGLHGYSLDFIPTTPSYVEIPASQTQLDFTSQNFSLIARIYPDTLTVNHRLFMRGSFSTYGYELQLLSVGALFFRTNQTGANQVSSSSAGDITTGAWYTIGISRNGAAVAIYKNGVAITSTAGIHVNPLTCPLAPVIGASCTTYGAPFDGKIEFLRVFGGIALSTSEHLAWHNALA